jgi:hypothetical protein
MSSCARQPSWAGGMTAPRGSRIGTVGHEVVADFGAELILLTRPLRAHLEVPPIDKFTLESEAARE